MFNTNNIHIRNMAISLTMSGLLFCNSVAAEEPVNVTVYSTHGSDGVTYHYKVTNNHPTRSLVALSIGKVEKPGKYRQYTPQLQEFPAQSEWIHDGEARSTGLNSSSLNWEPKFFFAGGDLKYIFKWTAKTNPLILPGESADFSLTLTHYDKGAIEGFMTAVYGDFEEPGMEAVTIRKADTTPPTGEISVTPQEIWPPNHKMIDVEVSFNLTDDFDPEPRFLLKGIKSNEELAEGDIVGAKTGTADTNFQLKATRLGTNKEGRIYTIYYLVYDGNGNGETMTVDVVVPHSRGE